MFPNEEYIKTLVNGSKTILDNKFAAVDNRIDSIEISKANASDVERSVSSLSKKLDSNVDFLNKRINNLQTDTNIQQQITDLQNTDTNIQQQIVNLQNSDTNIQQQIVNLQNSDTNIQQQIVNLQKYVIPSWAYEDEGEFLRIVNGNPTWTTVPSAEGASF